MSLDNEGIAKLLDDMDIDSKALKKDLLKLCWFMRGGIDYDDMVMLSPQDRSIIGDIVKENLETTKESKMPFF